MKKYIGWAVVALVLVVASGAMAAVIVGNTWETGVQVWGIAGDPGVANDGTGSPTDGAYGSISQGSILGENALIITGGGVSGVEIDYISADDDATAEIGYATYAATLGNMTPVQSVRFSFYDGEGLASDEDLRVYFYSDRGFTWFSDISSGSGWRDYGANFSTLSAGTWYSEDYDGIGDEPDWLLDSVAVQEIGIYLRYLDGVAGQDFGIGYFQLNDELIPTPVPEPETYAMLGFAMLSLCVTFRRKLEGSLQMVVQNFRG